MLLWLGHDEMCTPTFVSEFARIYSLPTQKYKDNFGQFKRYKKWLSYRNDLTIGFTEHENNHYMVADRNFSHCYSRYGFCSACGILRCSPVWCVCGYKGLSDGWTSNNKKLDEFIKKSQIQTTSTNDAYLEWIPFDCIIYIGTGSYCAGCIAKLVPLEINDETDDSYYYDKVNYSILHHVY